MPTMSKELLVTKQDKWICDQCGKIEVLDIEEKKHGWYTVACTESDKLRLFQKSSLVKRYESFNIPNQVDKAFCSRECIFKFLSDSVDVFISEISDKTDDNAKRIKL